MKREKLEKYLGRNVRVVLFDNTVIEGELHKTGEERFKSDASLYLRRNLYFCINPQSILFRCSHVVRACEADIGGKGGERDAQDDT